VTREAFSFSWFISLTDVQIFYSEILCVWLCVEVIYLFFQSKANPAKQKSTELRKDRVWVRSIAECQSVK
jgi:hypothetical protein